ncbi:MAG: hypothetical protein ACMXYD_03705 [Candidatus Woesearchaeota archaeon]
MKGFKEKTLLILTDYFPNENGSVPMGVFVKSQVDELKNYFKKIIVISPTPYAPNVLKNSSLLTPFQKGCIEMKDYSYGNVEVYFPRFYTLPINYFRKRNAEFAAKSVLKLISRKKLDFDFVHAHFTWMSGYIANQIKKKLDKEYFLTIHENSVWFKEELNSGDERIYSTWKNAKALIRVNKQDIPSLKKYNKEAVYVPEIVILISMY